MKKFKLRLILASILTNLILLSSANAGLGDFLERSEIRQKVREEIADLDINFNADLADIDLVNGVNLSARYRYEVEASYMDQYYTRVDKWDLKTGINVGDVVDNFIEAPFSFSINRQNSIIFVRQFPNKKDALKALPYSPKRLPLSGQSALKNLEVGDFVSIPANLNVAVEARASTSVVAPVVLNANAGVYYVISGEFIIQVFKVDETHVRLKLISRRGYDRGTSAGAGLSFKLFGIRILDRQIDRLFDRDLVQMGYAINPGSQFIVDYVFDLSNAESQAAYDQILKTTLKFNDLVVMNKLGDASDLKGKLISSFEKAEKLFSADRNLDSKNRRVTRIFKGFSDYKANTKKFKLAFLLTSINKDRAYTESKVTFIDKNENNLEFFYPTSSKYMESRMGKWIFDLKDQSFQNNFGLIPRFNEENTKLRNPDFGLTFERRDKFFGSSEQRLVQKFLVGQIPRSLGAQVDLSQWRSAADKTDSRIFLQLVLKSQGFDYLKSYSEAEISDRLVSFAEEKSNLHVLDEAENDWDKLKDFLLIGRLVNKERLSSLSQKIYKILRNEHNDSEIMTKELVKLNDERIFSKLGVGFLISLLPQDQLKDLVYVKLEMAAKDLKATNFEYGKLNYKALYDELTDVQSRIANRSYDLRVTDHDHQMEDSTIDDEKDLIAPTAEEFLGLN